MYVLYVQYVSSFSYRTYKISYPKKTAFSLVYSDGLHITRMHSQELQRGFLGRLDFVVVFYILYILWSWGTKLPRLEPAVASCTSLSNSLPSIYKVKIKKKINWKSDMNQLSTLDEILAYSVDDIYVQWDLVYNWMRSTCRYPWIRSRRVVMRSSWMWMRSSRMLITLPCVSHLLIRATPNGGK